MSGTTGIFQYADWGVGTAKQYSLGIVTGGEIGPGTAPIVHREGSGGQARMVGGLMEYSGSIEFLPTGSNDASLLSYFQRSSYTTPAMTALAIEGGSSDQHGYLHTGCYVDTFTISCAVGEALQVSFTWQGLDCTRVASPSPSTKQTGLTYEWNLGNVTIDGSGYECQSISISGSNGLRQKSSLDTKASGAKRKPEWIEIGPEVITASLVIATPADNSILFDLSADTLDIDVDVVWTASNGTGTYTFTLNQMACSANPMPFVGPDGEVDWNVELEGVHNTAGVLTIAHA